MRKQALPLWFSRCRSTGAFLEKPWFMVGEGQGSQTELSRVPVGTAGAEMPGREETFITKKRHFT